MSHWYDLEIIIGWVYPTKCRYAVKINPLVPFSFHNVATRKVDAANAVLPPDGPLGQHRPGHGFHARDGQRATTRIQGRQRCQVEGDGGVSLACAPVTPLQAGATVTTTPRVFPHTPPKRVPVPRPGGWKSPGGCFPSVLSPGLCEITGRTLCPALGDGQPAADGDVGRPFDDAGVRKSQS